MNSNLPPLLVVDDERNMRRSLQAMLQEEGYKVCPVESAEEALARLHKEIFSPLKREISGLRLAIIGRDPDSSILSLGAPDVEITGTVPVIWPHIANVSVFVYPMTSGAGLQNKILEAMHAGKPVVTTEICAESIGAQEGREILIGRSDGELLSHTRNLLMNPEYAHDIGLQGKAYADRTFDMPKVVKLFEQFILPSDP